MDNQLTVQLIGVGRMPAIPAGELKRGMRIMWNYGSTYEVLHVYDITPKFIEVIGRSNSDSTDGGGKEYTFRRKKESPIVAYWPNPKA